MLSKKRGNEYYSLQTNEAKNRIYFTLAGLTPSVDAIPNFEADWRDAVGDVKPGFTILGDLREMMPHPPDVEGLNVKVQKWLLENGCRKVAQVAPIEVVAHVNAFSEKSGLKSILRGFHYPRTAEIWLDR
ncbi:MAG: hypothetical protein ACXACI_04990 [Candidatus Hodarchaeales archaeon]|jgi:hypothetical protein